jgi:hypothetical protein
MQCQPDGSACSPIQGATDPSYTVQPDDAGMTLEMEVTARVRPPGYLPDAVVVDTAPTPVVTYPPGVTPPPPTTTSTTSTTPPPPPQSTPTPPTVGKLSIGHHHRRNYVTFTVSGPGAVTVELQLVKAGHRGHRGQCVAGKRRHARKCVLYRLEYRINQPVSQAGTVSVFLPLTAHGRKLPAGNYRLLVIPASGAVTGTARSFALSLGA